MYATTRRLALAAVLLSALPAAGADDYPIKVYPCPRLAPAPTIDGACSEACWKQAIVVSGFTAYNRPGKLVSVQTSFRAGYDDACLYFGVHCDEPLAERLTPSHAGRDSSECFRGETVEIFVDPNHDHAEYFQFAVNFAGSFFDGYKTDRVWNSRSRVKTARRPGGWELEIAIPWRDLGVRRVRNGMVVGFNVCRDREMSGRVWSNWSQTKSNFHDPERFAHLVLSPSAEMLGRLSPELRKGGRRGPIVVLGRKGEANRAYLAMAKDSLARLDARLDALAAEGAKEPSEVAREAMARCVASARRLLEPYRVRLKFAKGLDAAEWTRMCVQTARLERQFDALVWDARLAALLKKL